MATPTKTSSNRLGSRGKKHSTEIEEGREGTGGNKTFFSTAAAVSQTLSPTAKTRRIATG